MFRCCCLFGFGVFVCFWPWCSACGILVPWPGIELRPWQWKLRVLTTGFPGNSHYYLHFIDEKTETQEFKSLVQGSRVQNDQSQACTYSPDSNRRPMLLLRHPRSLGAVALLDLLLHFSLLNPYPSLSVFSLPDLQVPHFLAQCLSEWFFLHCPLIQGAHRFPSWSLPDSLYVSVPEEPSWLSGIRFIALSLVEWLFSYAWTMHPIHMLLSQVSHVLQPSS